MTRRLLNLLTVTSLALFAAVAVLWVRSAFGPTTWVVSRGTDRAVLVRSAGRSLQVGRQSVEAVAAAGDGVSFDLSEPGALKYRAPGSVGSFATGWYEPGGGIWSAGSVNVVIGSGLYRIRCHRLRMPYWLLAVATAGPPAAYLAALAWQRRRSERRRLHALCTACGYDLTGNVSGVCPECGERRRVET